MKKSLFKKIIILLLFISALAGGIYFWQVKKTAQVSTNNLVLGQVKHGDLIQRVTIMGVVVPFRQTLISAPYNGFIKKIFVSVGEHVVPGTPLVSIAPSLETSEPIFPLRAPFEGVVTNIPRSEGEYVKDGDVDKYILRIDDMKKYFINAKAPEIDVNKLKIGMSVVIKASSLADKTYNGIIRKIALAPEQKSQNFGFGREQVEYPVRIEILDNDSQLRSGLSSINDIITNHKENVWIIEHEFVNQAQDRYYLITKDGVEKDIKIGLQNETHFEIISGVDGNEIVRQVDFSSIKAGSF